MCYRLDNRYMVRARVCHLQETLPGRGHVSELMSSVRQARGKSCQHTINERAEASRPERDCKQIKSPVHVIDKMLGLLSNRQSSTLVARSSVSPAHASTRRPRLTPSSEHLFSSALHDARRARYKSARGIFETLLQHDPCLCRAWVSYAMVSTCAVSCFKCSPKPADDRSDRAQQNMPTCIPTDGEESCSSTREVGAVPSGAEARLVSQPSIGMPDAGTGYATVCRTSATLMPYSCMHACMQACSCCCLHHCQHLNM